MGRYCSCGKPFDIITYTFEEPSGLLTVEEFRFCPSCDCIDVAEVYDRKSADA